MKTFRSLLLALVSVFFVCSVGTRSAHATPMNVQADDTTGVLWRPSTFFTGNAAAIRSAILPTQTGQAGKYLQTDGSTLSWQTAATGVPTQITVSDTTDTTAFLAFFESATGDLAPKTDLGATYNAATGVVTFTGIVGPLTGNVTGNLTGNVTGNVSGTSGSTTGNAATATALETARTIGGTSFNGTANIVPATITVADTTDSTSFLAFFESATGDLAPKTDLGATYNASTGVVTFTGIIGPLTGNVTGNLTGNVTGNADTATLATTATTANAGDSATSFFSSGTIERARGGTAADTSAYGAGLLGSDGSNNTIDVDTIAEVETAIGGTNVIISTEIDTSSEVFGIVGDESGTGVLMGNIDPVVLAPNNALGALAIDVTKKRNTKTATAAHTFTFSATPSAGTTFGLVLTGDSVARVITIPSSFSLAQQTAITTFTLQPSPAKVELSWVYDGTTYFLAGEPTTIADLASITVVTSDTLAGHDVSAGTDGEILISDLLALGMSDTAIAGSWNGVTTVAPTKNAIHDWAIVFDTDLDGKVNVLDIGVGITNTDSSGVIQTPITTKSGLESAIGSVDLALASGDTYSGSHDFTGATVTVATASANDNDTSPASTAYVQTELTAYASDTVSLTNKTLDASATGNVVKLTGEIQLTHPHLFGSGVTQDTTITSETYGQALFGHATDKATNYIEYRLRVPKHLDTAVDLTATFEFVPTGTDTGDHEYEITFDSIAASGDRTGTLGDAISLGYTADASGAAGDTESTAETTLTGWRSAMTAGQIWVIRVARDGDHASDTSTVTSYSGTLTITYGISQ